MNSTISLLIGAILIIGIGSFVFLQMDTDEMDTSFPPVTDQSGAMPPANNAPSQAQTTDDDGNDDGDDDANENTPGTAATGGTNTNANTTATPPATTGAITLTVVAQHNTRASCWSAINGNVYDLTSWIPKHPGGEQGILNICGKDGSSKFNGQHGGAAKQAAILAGFKVGILQ